VGPYLGIEAWHSGDIRVKDRPPADVER